MARVCVVGRVISNFMGSTSSRLKGSMKLALLVLLCNCLCCFSVVVAIITDDMRRQIDRWNNASQPSKPKSQRGSWFDRIIPKFYVPSGMREPFTQKLPPYSKITHTSLHLDPVIYNGRLSKMKDLNLSSLPPSVPPPMLTPVSVPLLNTSSLRNMWIKSVPKPLGSTITISSDSRSLDTLLSTDRQTSAKNTTPSPVDITIPNVRNFSDQVHNFTWNYTTTYSSLFNHTIRCNAVARYFHPERRESMHTFFSTYVQLHVGFDFLHEALLMVNITTTPGQIDLWLSVTLNETDTITMRLTQFSMVFDITRFLRPSLSRDAHILLIRFFCECNRLGKSTKCPQIHYHKPEILAKFC